MKSDTEPRVRLARDGRLTIPMAGKVTGAYLLAQPEKPLDVMCTGEAVVIRVPTSPPDPIASVVVASVGEVRPVQSPQLKPRTGRCG